MKFIITILFSLIVSVKSNTNLLIDSVSSLEDAFDNYDGNCSFPINETASLNLTDGVDENRILFRSKDESNKDMCVISTQINNWKSNFDEGVVWQYFASNDGLYAVYPYFNLTDCYDYEVQPWYVSAVTGNKNLVIMMDTSYSDDGEFILERMKEVVNEFLNSLSSNDYVTIVDYSSFARLYENASLVQGTNDNLGYLKSYVDGISVSQISRSNVDSALEKVNFIVDNEECRTNIYVLLGKSRDYVDVSGLNNSLFFHYIFEGNRTMCGSENYSFSGFVDYFALNCSDVDYVSVINSTYSKMVCTESEGFKGVMGMNTTNVIVDEGVCDDSRVTNGSISICDNKIEEIDEEGLYLWLVTLALIIVFSVLITAPVIYVFGTLKDESFRSIINLKCNIIWTSAVMIVLFGWFVLAFYLAMWDEIVRESEWVFTDMIVDGKDEGSFDCCFVGASEGEGLLLKNCLELKEMNVEGDCLFNGEIRSTVCGECYEPTVSVLYFDGNSEMVSSVFGESCDMDDRDCLDGFLNLYPDVDGSFGGYYNKNNSLDVMYSIVGRSDALGWTISASVLIVVVAVAQWLMIWDYKRKN